MISSAVPLVLDNFIVRGSDVAICGRGLYSVRADVQPSQWSVVQMLYILIDFLSACYHML